MLIVLPSAPLNTVGDANGSTPVTETPTTPVSATAAANTAVVITVNGVANQTIRITELSCSYSAAPTAGALTVVVNGVTIFQADITAGGFTSVPLPPGGLKCQSGQNAVITLTAAGAAVAGRLNAGSYYGS